MGLAQGASINLTEPSRTTPGLDQASPVSRLAEELALALGCPVKVSYLHDTREVVAVAYPEPNREVRVSLPVSLIAIRLLENPFFAVKYNLFRQLRYQMDQDPTANPLDILDSG
jgi:hypothetical protein